MTNSYQPSSSTNHILMERAITGGDGLPSLSLPISATIDGAQHGYNSFPIEAQTHGPTRMFVDRTRSCVTSEPNAKHSSDNINNNNMGSAYGGTPASPHRYIPSANDVDINFVRPFAPAFQLARYPPKKNIFAGDSTEQSNHYSESSSSSRAAPYHLPPIQVAASSTSDDIRHSNRNSSSSSSSSGSSGHHPAASSSVLAGAAADPKHQYQQQLYHSSNRMLAEPVVRARAFHHHHHTLSSNNSPLQLSSLAPSFSRETNRSMSEYLLHCAADQQEKQLANSSNRVNNNGPTSNNTWPKSWDRERFSSQADKSPGIIIDGRLGDDDDDDDDDDDSVGKGKKHLQRIDYNNSSTPTLTTGMSDHRHHRHNQPPPIESLKHLVSPHAIRKAEQEEQEEAMGGQPEHPFLAFPSFMSMKHLHEDQIKAYYHRTSSPPRFSTPASNYTTESPSPSSSISFSPLSGQASGHTHHQQQQQQPTLRDSHHSHRSHSSSLVLEHSPQHEHHQQEQQPPPAKARERLKRPPNAYLLFNRDMRRKLLEFSPKMTVAEISKEIGERWKELPKDQRQLYISQAAMIKQDHLQNHPDFIYTRRSKAEIAEARKKMTKYRKFAKTIPRPGGLWAISPEHPAGPNAVDKVTTTTMTTTHDKRGQQRRRQDAKNVPRDPRGRKKKRHRHPTAPKHPMSGFLFYLSAVRPQIALTLPGSTVGPISKIIARQWRDMTDQERIPWLEKAEQDKARYAQEMQSYMARLEVKGDDDDLTLVNKKVSESVQQQQQQHSTAASASSSSSSYDVNQNRVIFMHSRES